MKKILAILAITGFAFLAPSCKGKVKDADVKAAAETAIAANPDFSKLQIAVTDGVVSVTGEVKDEATKEAAQTLLAGVKGVKSVQNNTTVYVAPPVVPTVTETQADALTKAVTDALKDFPGVVATVKDQVVVLTGEVSKSNLQKLMMHLNALKSMGLKSIDSKGLVKK